MTVALDALKRSDPSLYRDIDRLSRLLAKSFDVSAENMCTDVTHVASELLRAKGHTAEHVGTDRHRLPTDLGHAWVRVGDWNIDFTLGQFEGGEMLPYPFVTRVGSNEADALYGRGHVDTLPPEEARAAGYPLLADLKTADQGESICDLAAFSQVAKKFL